MTAETTADTPRRRYRSPRRAQQATETRGAVLAAATELFSTRGWARTSVRDVAGRAGVSVETVHSTHGTKIDLLLSAVDAGVVGDLEPVALAERSEFEDLHDGTLAECSRAAARLAVTVNRRTAGLHRALREAAAAEPETAGARLREMEERRRTDVAKGLALMPGVDVSNEERDGIWAVTAVEVYELLVTLSGWTVEQYEHWLTDAIERLIQPREENS
jgi:AcrR family transcriptional regulator